MNSMAAFAMGMANRGREQKVFDWDKAAEFILRAGVPDASAGLEGDWEYTGGFIFADGKPIPAGDTYVFLSSTWATPELQIGDQTVACYRMASDVPAEWLEGVDDDDWAHIYWPESALCILRGEMPRLP